MSKKMRALFLALAIMFTFNSKNSQAAVGLVTANPAVVTIGLVMAAGGGVGLLVATKLMEEDGDLDGVFEGIFLAIAAGAIGAVGLLVLDGEQGYSFAELNQKNALKLGITEEERKSFNSEIDQVNALAGYVDQELSKMKNPTVDESMALWTSVADAVSPQTLKAMQKVSIQLLK